MVKLIILFTSLLTTISLYSQITIVDSKSKLPIPFVIITVDNGELGAVADLNGVISLDKLDNLDLSANCMLTLQHISYKNEIVSINDFKKNTTFSMNERFVKLEEVVIRPNQFDYIVLKGFFRSYQLDDNEIKYYSDGIIEYYIPLKGGIVKFKPLEYRTFRNKILIDKQIYRTATLIIKLAGFPDLEAGKLLKELKSKYKLRDLEYGKEILLKGEKVGSLKNNKNHSLQIDIDKIRPNKEEIHSLFGYTTRIVNTNITEVYLSDSCELTDKSELLSRKEYRKFYFKHKSEGKEKIHECVNEFYTIGVNYAIKSEIKNVKLITDRTLKESHQFRDNYWENIEEYGIPPVSEQIENEFGKSLIMY